MIGDPSEVMRAEAGAGYDVKFLLAEPGNRQVRFDAAARVEELGVGQPPNRFVDIVGADPVERPLRVRAAHFVLGEGRLIEDADRLAHMAMLVANGCEPVLAAHRINVRALASRQARTS